MSFQAALPEVFVEIAMLGRSGGIKPVIVDDYHIGSELESDIASLQRTEKETASVPAGFALYQNYPNPFNPETAISFDLPGPEHVELTLYNLLGEQVAQLVNGPTHAGKHTIRADLGSLPSGLYVYRITAGTFTQTRRLMLVK